MEGVVAAGIAGLEKHEFSDMDELKDTIADVQVTFTTETCTSLKLEWEEGCILLLMIYWQVLSHVLTSIYVLTYVIPCADKCHVMC